MNKETKQKILSATEHILDEVDEVMSKVQAKYQSLETKTQEVSQPHVERLAGLQEDLKQEYAQLKQAGEGSAAVLSKKFNEYTVGFMRAYEDLTNSGDDSKKVDTSEADAQGGSENAVVDWTDIPPPSIQLGHPNPPASMSDPQVKK